MFVSIVVVQTRTAPVSTVKIEASMEQFGRKLRTAKVGTSESVEDTTASPIVKQSQMFLQPKQLRKGKRIELTENQSG